MTQYRVCYIDPDGFFFQTDMSVVCDPSRVGAALVRRVSEALHTSDQYRSLAVPVGSQVGFVDWQAKGSSPAVYSFLFV